MTAIDFQFLDLETMNNRTVMILSDLLNVQLITNVMIILLSWHVVPDYASLIEVGD